MSDERREGRSRLVAGAGLVEAECAVWRRDGPITEALAALLAAGAASRVWLREDLFRELCHEQGLAPHAWPSVVFKLNYRLEVRRRRPWIYECGCSRHKVDAGLCDSYAPGGDPRA